MKNRLLHFIIIAVLLCYPKIDFGQAPTLGTTANFVLFTSSGAVTNTGISQVTGHVGSNVGAATNFGNVNGVMQSQNAATAACSADLLTLSNELAAKIANFFPSSSLGGDTLLAGVYSITGASTLTNTLTLNAQGNPNAIFIFKLQGAFSAAANAKVKLINGAKACNVFWKIDGLVSVATGVTMRGTIIANNAAITMSAGDTLEGRAMSTAGAVSVNGIMAYTPIGCGSPFLTGPNAPPLGTTANYVLFTGIGAVTNTGITYATGDIGSNSALTTGFNPLFINGMIHPIPDASTNQCDADLAVVYNYLNALTPDIELLYPAQFGRNLVLTPHTYILNAATTLTDTLVLNGQGNPNAVFVIKIYGALNTSTFSNVVLTNGTKSSNVFWLVSGAVSINDNSIFRGTIIGHNGAISITTGSTLDGRALTNIGAVSVSAINAVAPNAPTVIVPPTSKLVCIGDTARFIVGASGTNLTYQWRKGNLNLVNSSTISGVTNDTLTIFPVSFADTASTYTVVIMGNVTPNDTTAAVSLRINSTEITTEPTNQNACIGNNVVFTIKTIGTGITYQWRKGAVNLVNGGNIQGATSDSLKIYGITISDIAANYNVIIAGTCSPRDTSNNAALNIVTTVINTQPSNQTSCLGNAATFITRATGSGLTYQWRRGNVNLINGGNISGVTNDTLRFNSTTIADTASNYNVIISSTCSARDTSNNVSLNINLPLVININPTNQTICSGSAVSFVTRATGSGLTYQWRRGNVNLINGGNISGVTNDTLRFNPSSIADTASNYNVIISSTCSTRDTSNNVSLNINLPLVVNINPTNQTICSGSAVSFVTRATGSGLTYQWRKGNVNLVNGGNISGATSDTLRFNPSSITDVANNYNVIISSTCSTRDTSANVSLNINLPLVVTINPTNQTICSGSAVSFITRATGSGLTYQWRRGNVNLVNGGNISGATSDTLRFNPSSIADTASNYNVIISSACSARDTSANVSLNINLPLVVNINPTNQTICSGSAVSFVTRATGSGLTYQWRKGNVNLVNGGNISGATSDTLRFNPSSIADVATNYNVIISSVCSARDTSANVSLNINLPLVITINPTNQTICSGNIVSFVTRATGSGLTYQWRKGNVNLVNGGNILGATSDTLRFNPSSIADVANNYNVIISSTCSARDTSANVSLNINLPLVVTINPTNQTICSGNIVSFVTRATGSGLTYQWRKGNVNLVNGGNISGVTSDTLRFNPSSIADTSSNYNVIISSACSARDTSANVSLNINLPLVININPTNQTICSGTGVSFVTRATGSGLTYQWRKGNVNLVNGLNITGATSDTLRFNAATIADAANNYNVIISSACSARDTSNNVSLQLNSTALILTEPIDQTVCVGSSINFSVTASGDGLSYQWRKGNVNLANVGNTSGVSTAMLTINPVSILDASNNYNVIVSGSICPSSFTSANVSLLVNTPSVITSQPTNKTTCEGTSVSFTVNASGSSTTYQWRKGLVNLINGGNISGASSTTLTLNNTSSSDDANNYNVVITGTCSSTETSTDVSLSVNQLPIAMATYNSAVCVGKSINLYAQTVVGASYNWTGPNAFSSSIQNPVIVAAALADSGFYSLIVTQNLCSSNPSIVKVDVKECLITELNIPEGFSPSGDGINDLYVIRGIENYSKNTLQVFNRWGNLVFEASPYQNTWNGKSTSGITIGGNELPVGVYFYVLDLGDNSGVKKGTIYLNK